ncbi:TonB-dependent receptor plug domain-containing protein [uncultured Dechloromonas sp.]|uniref:TonB-dependent receptor plug domain-containing protein n=1 Tax=uncultured Dechloromonas sp. TaxID=171719 RepID=UPI0025D850C8|nr:TonB-dependent receptor plug domain-containing protein [uncultured Dechloromonas sp.]
MRFASGLIAILSVFSTNSPAADPFFDDLTLEELVKTDITSVSRKSQSISDVAAAAFVISSEDIRRSGAQALPDVLRMVPGIQVAQIDNGRYAVTARSHNGRFATKLQVLIDGRSIYHPLFAGVMWELDPIPLEDIERIEVIRGAGAVMWGANAVNGLINIISKPTRGQAGAALNVAGGTQGNGNLYARFGQIVNDSTSWRLSAQGRHVDSSRQHDYPERARDRLDNQLVDFRLDHALGGGRDLSLWANATQSRTGDIWRTKPDWSQPGLHVSPYLPTQELNSQSLVGRYRWLSDGGIESSLQMSATRSGIDITEFLRESRNTYDIDYQGRLALSRHDLIWGLNHRSSQDDISTNEPYLKTTGSSYNQKNTGLFLHDDWTLLADTLKLGLGARADVTSRNGTNYSANATMLWTPTRTDTAWLKLAQAPRTSTRAERDISIVSQASVTQQGGSAIPVITYVNANRDLGAEMSRGLELGYRKQFSSNANVDISAYRYRLTKQRTGSQTGTFGCHAFLPAQNVAACNYFGVPTAFPGTPVIFNLIHTVNEAAGWNDGIELSADWLLAPAWRLQLSYAWSTLKMDRSSDPVVNGDAEISERAHPKHVASLRSQWNITSRQQFDLWLRGASGYQQLRLVDTVPNAGSAPRFDRVGGYATLDLRYAYRWRKDLEFALIGRNLIAANRVETLSDYIPTPSTEIPRTWLASTRWTF